MVTIGAVREIIGNGTFFGFPVLGSWYHPPLIIILAPGGFMVIGFIIGAMNLSEKRKKEKKERAELAAGGTI